MLDGAILGKQVQRIQILDDMADQAINNVFYFELPFKNMVGITSVMK